MTVYASKTLPSTREVGEILEQEFSPKYTCNLFGLDSAKTIRVRKSILVGAQISIRGNEITVQGAPASILSILAMTELAAVMIFFLGWLVSEPWKKT